MKLFIATAATKKQLSNATLVFGKTGEKVVTGLEALNKVFKHPGIDNFLDFLRSSEEVVEKWAASKSGVKAIENLKIAGTAKSVEKVLAAVASLKTIPRQDKGVVIPKDKMLDGPKPRATTVPVPSSGKGSKSGKYELTDETIKFSGKTLYRIKALKSFGKVKAGDLGGYIQSENNLSQDGNAWVSVNAKVFGEAMVYGNATVHSNAIVRDNAKVYGNAQVYNVAMVHDDAQVYGNAQVYSSAIVGGNAKIYDKAKVYEEADVGGWKGVKVYGDAQVYSSAIVNDKAQVYGRAKVYGRAEVYGNAQVYGWDTKVYGKAQVYGNAIVSDDARVYGNTKLDGKA